MPEPEMKYVADCENGPIQLMVFECACGFHIGIDFTYLDQVDTIRVECPNPSCRKVLDTRDFPECNEEHEKRVRLYGCYSRVDAERYGTSQYDTVSTKGRLGQTCSVTYVSTIKGCPEYNPPDRQYLGEMKKTYNTPRDLIKHPFIKI